MVLTQTVNGQTTSFEYDNMGRQTKVTAPGNVVTNTTYYPTGEVKRVDGATYPVEYTYNGLGMQATLKTFKDADTPQVTTWSYNNRGQMTAKTYADNSSVTYTYNGDGQLLTRTWARQVNGAPLVTTYSYDAAGRQTGYSYSDGVTPSVSMTLNFLDQPTSVTDAAGTRNFTYNSANQLANETIPGIVNGGLTYTYDTAGRRTAMSAGNGTATFANAAYTYDAMGRIATVGNSADTLTYGYVPGTGMIASSSWQTATVNTAYTYDSYKRLTNIAVNNTSVYGYTLNDKNQRTGATLPDGNTWTYDYDSKGQLTLAQQFTSTSNLLGTHAFSYDQIGNRTSATENNTTTTYTSNLVNQYIQIASQVPTYDADGNMTSYNGWTYTWNGENRLIAAENSDTRLEFSYDYMGRRIEKKVYSKGLLTLYDWSLEMHRKFVYDGYKLIAEFEVEDDNATLFASYLWQPESVGLDVPLMRIADNTQTYYIADGNKNIIALKDSSGADVSTYAYTPFGSLENPADGDENPFRFSSEYADDETGLVYYNYRYYSPQLGRWTKRDPIEEQGGENLYGFLSNVSVNTYDYLGLYSMEKRADGTYTIDVEKCEIVLFDGHGSDERFNTFRFNTTCSAAGFTGCYAKQNNEKIPKFGRLPYYPQDTGEIESRSEAKKAQRKLLAAAILKKAQSFCFGSIKNGKRVGCCKTVNIFVVSNMSSLWEGDRSASYTYDCNTGMTKRNSGTNPISSFLKAK